MTEQGNTGWGMTVSRRFDTDAEAKKASESLREAGFLEGEIRIWEQHKPDVMNGEDAMERAMEGMLGGGVIGGVTAFFLATAITWTENERTSEEAAVVVAIFGAVAGAIILAIAVPLISRKYAFSHPHEHHAGPGSVVTVSVGDREAQAKEVFDKLG